MSDQASPHNPPTTRGARMQRIAQIRIAHAQVAAGLATIDADDLLSVRELEHAYGALQSETAQLGSEIERAHEPAERGAEVDPEAASA